MAEAVVPDDLQNHSKEGQSVDPASLDPTQWKEQDHYAVLGLGLARHTATQEQIKKAYRQLVLKYHPDKQTVAGGEIPNTENAFACIKIAYDILSDPKKRMSFDSVDPQNDDTVPPNNAHSKENFFDVFSPVFASNSRWSSQQPVPQLGAPGDSYEQVDQFYSFWYNFDSWREFSYLDKEDSKKGEDREERRWLEKQNKAERLQLKREEMVRIRTLVDNAYACDPRVREFKLEEKQQKAAQRQAREEAVRRREEEKEKERQLVLEQERVEQETAEQAARLEAEMAKKEKEALKRELRSRRKALRALCKEREYFCVEGDDMAQHLQDLELLCEVLDAQCLDELTARLRELPLEDGRAVFVGAVCAEHERLEEEARRMAAQQGQSKGPAPSKEPEAGWSEEEMEVLVKAVNLFPPGTTDRWVTIADYVNLHAPGASKTAKQVTKIVKNLQQSDNLLKEAEQKVVYRRFEQEHLGKLQAPSDITERIKDSGVTITRVERAWTQDEQKQLEAALKMYPSSDPGRWDKIANGVPSRTRRECLARFKELVDRARVRLKELEKNAS